MTPLPGNRNPWEKFDGDMQRRRHEKPEGGTGTFILLIVFFVILGAIGVIGFIDPSTMPFRFPFIGRVGQYAIALACLYGSFLGLRMTIRFWRTGR